MRSNSDIVTDAPDEQRLDAEGLRVRLHLRVARQGDLAARGFEHGRQQRRVAGGVEEQAFTTEHEVDGAPQRVGVADRHVPAEAFVSVIVRPAASGNGFDGLDRHLARPAGLDQLL